MAALNITLSFDNINFSAQVGDIVYYSYNPAQVGGYNTAQLQNTKKLGPIVNIENRISEFLVTVQYDDTLTSPPADGDFISFAKDKTINTSSLLGYYASVKFVNNSTDKVELFSIGSEISESSK